MLIYLNQQGISTRIELQKMLLYYIPSTDGHVIQIHSIEEPVGQHPVPQIPHMQNPLGAQTRQSEWSL